MAPMRETGSVTRARGDHSLDLVLGEEAGIEFWRTHPELDVQVIWVREDGSVALTEGLEENYQVNPQHQDLDVTVVEA
mgnify:CR=1 FL=1